MGDRPQWRAARGRFLDASFHEKLLGTAIAVESGALIALGAAGAVASIVDGDWKRAAEMTTVAGAAAYQGYLLWKVCTQQRPGCG